jgi:CBS domain-containing protein
MNNIEQLLAAKSADVWSIDPQATVYDGLKLMAEKEIGALLVIDDGKTVGIMSERDYARKVLLQGRSSHDTTIEEIMTRPVVTVRPERTIEECMELMTLKRIRHLPVEDDDGLRGVVSIGDLVKAIISEQQTVIEQLEHYIRG